MVYIVLDADLNTPATRGGVLDWMGDAHLLGVLGAHDTLAAVGGRRPMLPPHALRSVGTANITAPEQELIDGMALHVEPLSVVVDETEEVLARTAEWARGHDRLLVHVDTDVLGYEEFPIAENTDRRGGLHLQTLTRILVALCASPNWRAVTVTEINPVTPPTKRPASTS